MICTWLFENLVPLYITDSYYPNFFDNLLDTQFMDMDIDNYVVVTKILKAPTRRLLRNEITGQHWYPPDTALKATQPKREREAGPSGCPPCLWDHGRWWSRAERN
jgi:hypothetical protein